MKWKYILDAAALILLVIPTVAGYRKGMLKTLIGMSSLIVSILLAYFFSPYVKDFLLERTRLYDKVSKKTCEYLVKAMEEEEESEKADEDDGNAVDLLKQVLPKSFVKRLTKGSESALTGTRERVAEVFAEKAAGAVVAAAAILLTLLAAYLLIRVLLMVTGVVEKLPLIKTVNKTAGALLGLLRGLILCVVLCVIITALSNTGPGSREFAAMDDTYLMKYLYSGTVWLLGL